MSLLDLPQVPASLASLPGRRHYLKDDVQDTELHRCDSAFERKRQADRDRALRSYYRNRERLLAAQKAKRAARTAKEREAELARRRAAREKRNAKCK